MVEKILKWVFIIQCQLLLLLAYSTEGFEGGADAICHWLISRDAPSNPMLFLNQWNKPIFTVLSAPFAQFGLIGMRIFSVAVAAITGVVLQRISKEKLGNLSWLPAIILLMVPKFLELLTTSMTEPLFALSFALTVMLIKEEKYGWMALAAGLAPYVRQEGFALIAVAAAVLIYARKFRQLPLLGLGSLLMALVGWIMSGKMGWILTSFPYSDSASEIYGSGSIFHYVGYYRELFGKPISYLFVAGAIWLVGVVLTRIVKREKVESFQLALLAALAFAILFFGAHSYVWWKGMSGSLGLIRVMASIAPALALLAAYPIYRITQLSYLKHNVVRLAVSFSAIFLMYKEARAMTNLPTPLGQSQVVMQEAASWLQNELGIGKVYYSDAVFSYFAGETIDHDSPIGKSFDHAKNLDELNTGDIVVWDAHFSPNEGQLPLETLFKHNYYQKVKSFQPKEAFTVLGGHSYAIHIFQKTDKPVEKKMSTHLVGVQDFESPDDEFAYSDGGRNGGKCAISNSKREFVTLRQPFDLAAADTIVKFNLNAWVKFSEVLERHQLFLVSDIKERHYLSKGNPAITFEQVGEWIKLEQKFELPVNLPDEFTLACYVWNPTGQTVYVDDIRLEAVSLNQSTQ